MNLNIILLQNNKATVAPAVVDEGGSLAAQKTFFFNCFSARRQKIEPSQLFQFRELTGHTDSINAMEFSDDGTLLVSGGRDKTVRLWSLNQGRDGEWNSTAKETMHTHNINCLVISPDNRRIFSGGYDKKVLVHDTNTLVAASISILFIFHGPFS